MYKKDLFSIFQVVSLGQTPRGASPGLRDTTPLLCPFSQVSLFSGTFSLLAASGTFWASSGRGCVYHTLSAGASRAGPWPDPPGVQPVFISSCLFPEIPFLFRLINALWVKQFVLGVHTKFLELSVARHLGKP